MGRKGTASADWNDNMEAAPIGVWLLGYDVNSSTGVVLMRRAKPGGPWTAAPGGWPIRATHWAHKPAGPDAY